MRAKLANIKDCAVPYLSRAAACAGTTVSISITISITIIVHETHVIPAEELGLL